jgi:hypothetical protein
VSGRDPATADAALFGDLTKAVRLVCSRLAIDTGADMAAISDAIQTLFALARDYRQTTAEDLSQ